MGPKSERHEYQRDFFDYINTGSLSSARIICPLFYRWLKPGSLLDVGCGAGAWCKVWKEQGIDDVIGVDGDYVRAESLLILESEFERRDLSQPFDLGRRFDLVTSLEVAEHVPKSAARAFVENLARHGDLVVFSAAVPGQGGEFHVNEQPLSFWRSLFSELGFRCFDPVRSEVRDRSEVEPWYRYNTLLYARGSALDALPRVILARELEPSEPIPEVSPAAWRLRNAMIRNLPRSVVNRLVALKHTVSRRMRSTQSLLRSTGK